MHERAFVCVLLYVRVNACVVLLLEIINIHSLAIALAGLYDPSGLVWPCEGSLE